MAEYIESEAVNKLLQKEIERTWHRVWGSVIWELYHKISQIPTADVVEVVHGEWQYNTDDFTPKMRCSVCSYNKPIVAGENIKQEPNNYCPNCGAKMDSERGKDR